MRVRQLLPHNTSSVQEDWCAWLPVQKEEVFSAYRRQFDTDYAMFSVSLNEAWRRRMIAFTSPVFVVRSGMRVLPELDVILREQNATLTGRRYPKA